MSKTFSPSEAAFSVFELMKRQPQFVMRYAMLSAGVMAIYMFTLASTGAGEAMQRYFALAQSKTAPTLEQVQAILNPAMPALFFALLVSIILSAFLTGMALRKTLSDREVGFWGLQAGAMEGRYLIAIFAFLAAIIGAAMALSILTSLLSVIHMALGAIAMFATIPVLFWFGLRLSQFGVMGAVTGKLGLRESFEQTDRKFWRYAGAYMLWSVMVIIVVIIAQGLAKIGALALGTNIGSGFPGNAQEFATVGWAFYVLFYGMVVGVLNLGFLCVGAYAWHQSRGDLPPPKADS